MESLLLNQFSNLIFRKYRLYITKLYRKHFFKKQFKNKLSNLSKWIEKYSNLDPDSPQSAPGSNSGRTRPAWPSARSRRCWAAWRTWRGNCCHVAWSPLAATTTRRVSVVWRKCTGSCRAARRKSRSADNPRGAAAAARCSRRSCNNRCWCTRSVPRCCTRTSSRNEPRNGSPFFVSYLPRFSAKKEKKRNAVNPTSDRYTMFPRRMSWKSKTSRQLFAILSFSLYPTRYQKPQVVDCSSGVDTTAIFYYTTYIFRLAARENSECEGEFFSF